MSRMLGYSSPGELVSAVTDMRTQMYVDPLKRPEVMAALEKAEGWIQEVVEFRRKDGGVVPVEMNESGVRSQHCDIAAERAGPSGLRGRAQSGTSRPAGTSATRSSWTTRTGNGFSRCWGR